MPLGSTYGGYVWSGNEPYPHNPDSSSIGALALAGAGGVGAFYMATRQGAGGTRPIDYVAAATQHYGNRSPFQLGNTFRVPEILSPWTSDKYRGVDAATANARGFGFVEEGVYQWDAEFLKKDSTYDWIQHITKKSTQELRDAGITRGMLGGDAELASSLRWERQAGARHRGSLVATLKDGSRKVLSDDIALQSSVKNLGSVLAGDKTLNRIMTSIFGASGIYSKVADPNAFDRSVFSGSYGGIDAISDYMPVPALGGRAGLGHGTTLVRGIAAFEMDRFNKLLDDVSYQFLGSSGQKTFRSVFGAPGVRPGTASEMFMRFGGKAALAGGAILAAGELDWARRRFGMPGEVLASGAFAAGVGWATSKLTKGNPRTAQLAAVGAFFGQLVLPGFDQGIMQGAATTFANMKVVRGMSANPFNYYRRTLEGMAPGITSWQTGLLLGAGAAAATFHGGLPKAIARRWDIGIAPTDVDQAITGPRDIYHRIMANRFGGDPTSFRDRLGVRGRASQQLGVLDSFKASNEAWEAAESTIKDLRKNNPVNARLIERLNSLAATTGDTAGAKFMMNVKAHGLNTFYSFFGADLAAESADTLAELGVQGFKGLGKLGRIGTVAGGVLLGHQLLTGGLLGSMETAQELKDTYSGKKLVEVKTGRWWEAGGTPFSGAETSYFRPHQYHLMMTRAEEASVWGSDSDRFSPTAKFFLKNFTYHLEKQNYYDRPYPISGAAFQDVPIIGGMLSSTVGKLIKPARIMHAGEWIREGENGLEFASVYQGARREPAYSLGAQGPGVPNSPYAASEQLAFLSYQFRELEGLTGWAKNTVQKLITGSDQFGTDTPTIAAANEMSSWRRRFWDMDLGGMLGTNEFLRRFLPRTTADQKTFNPISNTMPGWLPQKFQYGDAYTSIGAGFARLPGAGYAALHPELKGVNPADYPLIYQYSILSDVAPYSMEYSRVKELVYNARYEGRYSEKEMAFIDQVDQRHAQVMNAKDFNYMHDNAVNLPGFGVTRGLYGGAQSLLRTVAAPAEYMMPMGIRPFQKLMGNRDMIEQYEYERLYGTPMSFWDKPVRDWFRPAMYSTLNMMGFEGKPLWRQEADATNQYFDQLQYLRNMVAAEQAEAAGDGRAARQLRWAAGQTRHGVNPMGNPLGIYWSLPDSERKFFNAFAHAQGADRQRILEMVPQDQAHLYQSIWSRMDSGDPSLWAGADTQVNLEYLASQFTPAMSAVEAGAMPPEDWIGWNTDVDMDDIKVRYINNIGRDIHDFGLWDSQVKKSMAQPFLEGSADYIQNQGRIDGYQNTISGLMGPNGYTQIVPTNNGLSRTSITYHDNREPELFEALMGRLNGY